MNNSIWKLSAFGKRARILFSSLLYSAVNTKYFIYIHIFIYYIRVYSRLLSSSTYIHTYAYCIYVEKIVSGILNTCSTKKTASACTLLSLTPYIYYSIHLYSVVYATKSYIAKDVRYMVYNNYSYIYAFLVLVCV